MTISGFVYLCYIVARYLLGGTVQGWASVVGVTLVLGGGNLFSLGMVGHYLSRVFEEVKRRPVYIFKQKPSPGTTED